MERRILLRGARQLLTLHGPSGPRRGAAMRNLGLIQDGAVLIVNGLIHDVGPSRRVENLAAARDAEEISADGRLLMPGFVDAHTHPVSGPPLLTTYEMRIAGAAASDIRAAGEGWTELARILQTWSRPRFEMEARKTLREFLRHGTTTLEAKSALGAGEKTALKMLRAFTALQNRPLDLLLSFAGAAALPENYQGPPGDYLDALASGLLPKLRRLKLARYVDARCGPGAFSPGEVSRYLQAARQMGFLPRLLAADDGGAAAIPVAVAVGAVSIDLLEHVTEDEARALADSPCVATLLPGAAFHRRSDCYPPARRLIDTGVPVALASGFSSDRCPTCSLPAILSLACNYMRMSPAEAITAATINAAHALRCGDRLGSLEYGKQADLIMLNVSDYRQIPYHFGMNLVAMVMKRGDVVYPRMRF